jgi:hypothetical protein
MGIVASYKKLIAQMVDLALRAKKSNLISLPKAVKEGANCGNCNYWRDTENPEVGYCAQSQVSIFITKRQLCHNWGHKDAVDLLTKTKMDLEPDVRDMPPPTSNEQFEFNYNGGLVYKDVDSKERASAAGMLSLPKEQKGASCYNCQYSTSVGWCKNPKVNQVIHKDDRCNNWDYPGAIKVKRHH